MIPIIQQAITMGYTAAQILKYISSKFKSSSVGIFNAKQQGYSDEDILKFLSGKIKPKNQKNLDNQLSSQERYLKSVGIKTKDEKKETKDKFISGALGAGVTVLGAYNAYKNYGGMLKGLGQTFGLGGTAPNPGTPPNTPFPLPQPNLTSSGFPPTLASPTTNPSPQPQPISPGPGISQQIQQQAQFPVSSAMQPATQGQVAQASQAMQPAQQQPTQSIFEQLTSGIDLNSLDEDKRKQLQFLNLISDQLQSEGKPLEDPAFQKLAKKIKDVVKGNPGTIIRESSRSQNLTPKDPNAISKNEALPGENPVDVQKRLKLGYGESARLVDERSKNTPASEPNTPAQIKNTPVKQEKKIDPEVRYPKEFFSGKKKEEVDEFANQRINEAFSEIEQGLASGEDYGVFHGDEWQSVGSKDVIEGAPGAPNVPKRNIQSGKKLIQVIEDHVPIQGLYRYYFDTPEKRKKIPFNKFSRGYEKAVEEMIVKKTNPELYAKQQQEEKDLLLAISKNQISSSDLFDEMQNTIEEVLFKHYDDEFENYLTKMIKKIR